jgi:tungstate transport system ATP-binding protein
MSEPLYRLEGVSHTYGGPLVLQIDRLEIVQGEVLCLVGPVGAGKSTLLSLLAALMKPSSGQLQFGGQRLDEGNLPLEVRRRLTLVFQRPLLLAGTVRSNVEFGLRLRGIRQRTQAVDTILLQLGLTTLADRPVQHLSGGEKQLVALARAVVFEPEVLLLDEPTNNLDPARVVRVEEAIQTLREQRRTTIVWATHNLFQARRVAQRVALLLNGQLVEAASTQAFFESPADARTAAFVRGEMVY